MERILIGQLGTLGDCLLASPLARQIKTDYPSSHVTWAVSMTCRQVIDGNPYVDSVWDFCRGARETKSDMWYRFKREASTRHMKGLFDLVLFSQIHPDNYQNFDGTVRSSILRSYGRPITVPIAPIVRLRDEEVNRVTSFVQKNKIDKAGRVVFIETTCTSGQSYITPELSLQIAQCLIANHPECVAVLSGIEAVESDHPRIVDASPLSFKENAELLKFCDLLVGGSSGLSWLATSDWIPNDIDTIQLLCRDTSVFASMVHDHVHHNLNTKHIIELTESPLTELLRCISAALEDGVAATQDRYQKTIRPNFSHYGKIIGGVAGAGNLRKALQSGRISIDRYGFDFRLLSVLLWRISFGTLAWFFRASFYQVVALRKRLYRF